VTIVNKPYENASVRWLAIAVLAAAGGLGCQRLDDGAKDKFVDDFSCPKDRIEIRKRLDVDAYNLIIGQHAPPADVAADVARLAIWQQREEDSHSSWNAAETVFELRGCAQQALYTCTRVSSGSHAGAAMCSQYSYPPSVTRW